MDCSPPSFSVHKILQARILEWVAISSCRGFSWPRDQTYVSCVSSTLMTSYKPNYFPNTINIWMNLVRPQTITFAFLFIRSGSLRPTDLIKNYESHFHVLKEIKWFLPFSFSSQKSSSYNLLTSRLCLCGDPSIFLADLLYLSSCFLNAIVSSLVVFKFLFIYLLAKGYPLAAA